MKPVDAPEFWDAINEIFDDSSVAFGLLGIDDAGVPECWPESNLDKSLLPLDRARHLKRKLEEYVVQMSNEVRELGEAEMPRLQAEASGLLIAIREMGRHFPEIADE